MSRLAIFGGKPVREKPYLRHSTMIGEEEERQVLEVLWSGHLSGFSAGYGERFLGGRKVQSLEEEFADRFGVEFAVSTNSGTSALHCAISAIGVEPGDEIITSPFTMSATASAILTNNAIPVFADIEPSTYGLDPGSVSKRITKRTRAILTVNLFGHPSRLDELKAIADDNAIPLIEDNAQSPGAMYKGKMAGSIGEIGIQSLNYHKCIQSGEGGMALTNNLPMCGRMRSARNHGEVTWGGILGGNHRMTELTAAIASAQLKKLDHLTDIRKGLSGLLTEAIGDFDFLEPPITADGCSHVYYLYPFKYLPGRLGIKRASFAKAMRAEGISISEGYSTPIYWNRIYKDRSAYGRSGWPWGRGIFRNRTSYKRGICPVAEEMYVDRLLTTDICKWPNTEHEVAEFAEAVKKISDNIGEVKDNA